LQCGFKKVLTPHINQGQVRGNLVYPRDIHTGRMRSENGSLDFCRQEKWMSRFYNECQKGLSHLSPLFCELCPVQFRVVSTRSA
jgi:hypothetical protein